MCWEMKLELGSLEVIMMVMLKFLLSRFGMWLVMVRLKVMLWYCWW